MRYSECLAHGWKGEASGCEYHKPDRFQMAYAEATADQPEQLTSVDSVDNPPHYTSHPSGIEATQITEQMDCRIGSAMK